MKQAYTETSSHTYSSSISHFFQPLRRFLPVGAGVLAALLLTACQCGQKGAADNAAAQTKAMAIRINAGATAPYTDPSGNVWLPDQGFTGGKSADRGNIEITGTTMPDIYRTEHYSMTALTQPVPNGKYTVKLHFAETFARITDKGQRVFSVKVEDQEIKDLDIFTRAGAQKKAWVETVNVVVSDGNLNITFAPGVQNPLINGIEIIGK